MSLVWRIRRSRRYQLFVAPLVTIAICFPVLWKLIFPERMLVALAITVAGAVGQVLYVRFVEFRD